MRGIPLPRSTRPRIDGRFKPPSGNATRSPGRRPGASRVLGPYPHHRLWRLVVVVEQGRRETFSFATRAEAEEAKVVLERRCEVRNGTKRGWVYFLQPDGLPYIKIGVARFVKRRLVELQQAWPLRLLVLAAEWSEDAPALEATLHGRFEHLHVRGEWHRPEADLIEYIRAVPPWNGDSPP